MSFFDQHYPVYPQSRESLNQGQSGDNFFSQDDDCDEADYTYYENKSDVIEEEVSSTQDSSQVEEFSENDYHVQFTIQSLSTQSYDDISEVSMTDKVNNDLSSHTQQGHRIANNDVQISALPASMTHADIPSTHVPMNNINTQKRPENQFFRRESPFSVPTSKPQQKKTYDLQLGTSNRKKGIEEPTSSMNIIDKPHVIDKSQIVPPLEKKQPEPSSVINNVINQSTQRELALVSPRSNTHQPEKQSSSIISSHDDACSNMLHTADVNEPEDVPFPNKPMFSRVRFNVITPAEPLLPALSMQMPSTRDKKGLDDYMKSNSDSLKEVRSGVEVLNKKVSELSYTLADGLDRLLINDILVAKAGESTLPELIASLDKRAKSLEDKLMISTNPSDMNDTME